MAEESALRDRYRGTLLGSACGDALGATVEFLPREEIATQFGTLRDIIGGGWLHLQPGEVTDDTQMALCIAESLVELRTFDPDDIAGRFAAWYHSNPPDIGNTTRSSLKYFADGRSWEDAGAKTHEDLAPRDASNGSIMRCAPVALYARRDPGLNARCSAISSRITHTNYLSVDSTVALNAAIAALLEQPTVNPLDVAMSASNEDEVRAALRAVPQLTADDLRAGGYVLDTMQASFWAVTRHDTLEEAIVAAVNLGNDADTTGAVAGALAGAKWGVDEIPGRWLDVLIPEQELAALADQLLIVSFTGN